MKNSSETIPAVKAGAAITNIYSDQGPIPEDHLVVIAAACAAHRNRIVLKIDDSHLRKSSWVMGGRIVHQMSRSPRR